ncbi:PREDICTED: receptor-like serine/threonine-protein kinase SD1-8 isoform X2 [Brassica oleracea var. oleracea]|uniref:receptor-like serine/threonine-protein kinase SD1-8 isoform X2 n=1 Tax=Brassica oleracea var. oleracea TaxID=109376 RepID=UPI0006A70D0E|nr:PREDICTED: receptor-like serine/threonine-protein kinase SD1-8 isoform X2 [Brassica oleracea var. oleracea]
MKGVQSTYHHSYTLSFLLVLFLFHPILSIDVNTLSSTDFLTISSNRTLVSHGGVFELGFFKPSALSRWYLGIWYKKLVSDKTYAWVANRDNPLSTSSGSLKISGNNLVLLGQFNNCVWSTNITRGKSTSPVMAELLPNGNLVMRYSYNNDSPSGFLWQSFDFPTDTLLPDMKLGYDHKTGRNRFLTSWRNFDDPSSGDFTYKFYVRRGLPELFLKKNYVVMERSGLWNGIEFSGMPEERRNHPVYDYTENSEEVAIRLLIANQSIYSRLTIIDVGYLHRSTLIPPSRGWSNFLYFPKDDCDAYKSCGPYAYCDLSTSPRCNCFEGFDPMNRQQWDLGEGSDGCVRRTPLSCSGNRFLMLRKMKLPDAKMSIADRIIDLKKCEERCLTDCNCTSFAAADVRRGVTGCFIWTGELYDTRTYSFAGQDLYVKVANVDLDTKYDRNGKIIRWSIGVSLMLILSVIVFCFWKRRQKQAKLAETPIVKTQVLMNRMVLPRQRNLSGDNQVEDLEVPLIEFEDVLIATEHFSDCNKVGKGGFGVVYKGRLLDGQEIAVKRLSEMSAQGTNEFMNEVRLIARLQHINLVQLLGCCVDEGEKILIYEYLENLSLDSHLFDLTRRRMLNWQMRFDIINGIARGILYLHHDSSIRIIHRDLKASNILLDKDMTPKISDFGMARIFGRDETEANTRKVVGTYGYMSPEYALDGIFSIKSDIYSFGVLLLEIISGKRNKGFYYSGRDYNLLECVWRNWKEGQGLAIVDTVIIDSSSPTFRLREILRCLQIALLCVQARVEDRPLMSSVVLMLGSEAEDIPQPKPPGYCVIGNSSETYSTWSKQPDNEACTVNQITMSIIDAR